MIRCGYCGHENNDSTLVCAGCGKALKGVPATKGVKDLNDPALDPVIVATFENTEHAGVLKAELEAAGIEAWIPEDFSVEFPPQTASVQVAAKDFLVAREMAAEYLNPRPLKRAVEAKDAATEEDVSSGAASVGAIPGRRACVSCGAPIPYDAVLCPKCGWTQPQYC